MPVQENPVNQGQKRFQSLKERVFTALKSYPTLTFLLLTTVVALIVVTIFFTENFFTNPAAIEVNGQKISKTDLARRIDVMKYFYTTASPYPEKLKNLDKDQAEFLIQLVLCDQFLKEKGNPLTNEELNNYLNQKAQSYGGVENYKRFLSTQYHETIDDVKLSFKDILLQQKIVGTPSEKLISAIWLKRIKPSDNANDLTTNFEVIENKLPPEEKAVFDKAKMIEVKAKSGENFESLVSQYSEDPVSKAKKGSFGWVSSADQLMKVPPQETNISSSSAQPQAPGSNVFPAVAVILKAWDSQGVGVKIYGYPSGFAIIKVSDVKGGESNLTGGKDFESWYQDLRKKAVVKFFT